MSLRSSILGFPPLRRIRAGTCAVLLIGILANLTAARVGRAATVNVDITADNGYSFGYGNATAMTNKYGDICNTTAGNIFFCYESEGSTGVESYSVPGVNSTDYLYIIGWADHVASQGVIGQFKSGSNAPVYTGVGQWQVFATGHLLDCGETPPTLDEINAQIVIANAGIGGPNTSGGWVGLAGGTLGNLVFGEDNTDGGTFPGINCLDQASHWMWFNASPSTVADAFHYNAENDKEYLIFRLAADIVLPTSGTTWGRLKTIYR